MRRCRWLLGAAFALAGGSSVALAQREARVAGKPSAAPRGVAASAPTESESDSLAISVLTMGPGEELYSRFGHQSVRVRNLRTGLDSAYNWGMFDFEQPNFIWRFLTGNTLYWMQSYPTVPLVTAYRNLGRAVWEQELDLTAQEKDSLYRYIQWNALEANKWYRYDYYLDNCATRVRDLINNVLHGAFRTSVAGKGHGVSFRSETMRLSTAYPITNVGMDFALGARADSALSAWDEMFIPMRVREWLNAATVTRADGTTRPLVRSDRVMVDDARFADDARAPSYFVPALITGLLLAAAFATMAAFGAGAAGTAGTAGTAGSSWPRWTFGAVGGLWHLAAGAIGVFVTCLGLFTHHVYMSQNVNVLLGTPVSLALALLLPLSLAAAPPHWVVRSARRLAGFAAGAAVIAVLAAFIAGTHQLDYAPLALMVPPHLAITWGLLRATRRARALA